MSSIKKGKPSEARALQLLSAETGFAAKSWPKAKHLIEIMQSLSGDNDALEIIETVGDLLGRQSPDGYFIVPAGCYFRGWNPALHHLCLVEVEITSPMTERKVQNYGVMWDMFHCSYAWQLHLIIFDKYDQWREPSLLKFYERNFNEEFLCDS